MLLLFSNLHMSFASCSFSLQPTFYLQLLHSFSSLQVFHRLLFLPTRKRKHWHVLSTRKWSPSADNGCPLTMYSIYYRQIQPPIKAAPWYQVNVTNVTVTNYTVSLACDRQYTIEISAWNELGQSDRSRPWITKTKSGSFTIV